MLLVTQYQLQRVDTWRQIQHAFCLTMVKMQMVPVARNRCLHIRWLFDIDQQVMMTRPMSNLAGGGGGRDAKALDAEFHLEWTCDHGTAFDPYEKDPGIRRRRMRLRNG